MSSDEPPVTAEIAIPESPRKMPRSIVYRLLRMIGLYVLVPYLAVVLLITLFQRRIIYRPDRTERLLAVSKSPDGMITDLEITTEDNRPLYGWRYSARPVNSGRLTPVVIYFPGNAGCRATRVSDCRDFTRFGCETVIFDYRGYGDNEGSPSEDALVADAKQVWKYVTQEQQTPASRVLIYGESLGGAVAIRLAAECCAAGESPGGLMLNSTFSSLGDVAAEHYPAFPFRYCLWDQFSSDKWITKVTCPIVQFHGTADDIVPLGCGERLFAAAPAQSADGVQKEFVKVDDGQHNSIGMNDIQARLIPLLRQIWAGPN